MTANTENIVLVIIFSLIAIVVVWAAHNLDNKSGRAPADNIPSVKTDNKTKIEGTCQHLIRMAKTNTDSLMVLMYTPNDSDHDCFSQLAK